MQVQEWLIEREQLLGRIKELKAENAELRKRLGKDITPIEKKPTAMQNLSLKEKVDLFIMKSTAIWKAKMPTEGM